ncbi:MAG: molybdate ABC transporter substrate-binding protein [Nitrospira sp.]
MKQLLKILTAGCLGVWLLFGVSGAQAEQVQVAVAANFVPAFKDIAVEFEKQSGHTIQMNAGASGKFYAQIKNGAPFDVFFSADDERPKLLEQEGFGVRGTRLTYAIGRLVLWSQDPTLVVGEDVLKTGKFKHLAMANPQTAPYGTAAMQAMKQLGVWENLQPRIVMGESLGQAIGYVESGNAELGFIALSQALEDKLKGKGSRWDVPSNLHEPIRQDVILLTKGRDNPAAKALMEFIRNPQTRAVLERYGYELE